MTTPNDLPSVGTEDAPGRLSTAGDCGDWSASHEGLGSSCYQALKDDAGTVIALVVAYDKSVYSDPDTRTNARRLVACWNALEGVPTEDIESVLIHGKALKDVVSERDELASRVGELEGALKPNLFWNDADPEHGETTIFEVIDREWNGGCMKHGDEMVIQQAVRLPNIRVRLIPCPTDGDDYFDYEVIDAALNASKEQP